MQEEAAERAFDAQDLALLHRAKHVVGKKTAGCVADMQLQARRAVLVVRRNRHRIGTARATGKQKLDVLTGVVAKAVCGDKRSMVCTRTGIFLIGKALSSVTWRDSITTSLVGTAQHGRIMPSASSCGLSARSLWGPCTTVPLSFLHLQELQAPSLQPYGRPTPLRIAAVRIASEAWVANARPLGRTEI